MHLNEADEINAIINGRTLGGKVIYEMMGQEDIELHDLDKIRGRVKSRYIGKGQLVLWPMKLETDVIGGSSEEQDEKSKKKEEKPKEKPKESREEYLKWRRLYF